MTVKGRSHDARVCLEDTLASSLRDTVCPMPLDLQGENPSKIFGVHSLGAALAGAAALPLPPLPPPLSPLNRLPMPPNITGGWKYHEWEEAGGCETLAAPQRNGAFVSRTTNLPRGPTNRREASCRPRREGTAATWQWNGQKYTKAHCSSVYVVRTRHLIARAPDRSSSAFAMSLVGLASPRAGPVAAAGTFRRRVARRKVDGAKAMPTSVTSAPKRRGPAAPRAAAGDGGNGGGTGGDPRMDLVGALAGSAFDAAFASASQAVALPGSLLRNVAKVVLPEPMPAGFPRGPEGDAAIELGAVGIARYYSPRHYVPCNSTSGASKSEIGAWW